MKIGFVCNSPYQILIAAIYKELVYRDEAGVLLIDDYLGRKISDNYNFENQSFFSDCIVIPSFPTVEYVDKLMVQINLDVIGMFNWGSEISKIIYRLVDTKFILLDEGLGSYRLQEIWKDIIFDKISEIWLLEPKLSMDKFNSIIVNKIPLDIFYDNENYFQQIICELNQFFNYFPKKLPTVIYFDRYFVSENTLPQVYEKKLIDYIISTYSSEQIGIKIHPTEDFRLAQYRYSDYDVVLMDDYLVPWELMLLQDRNSKILLSINSTPIIYSQLFAMQLKLRCDSICLIDLVYNVISEQEHYIIPLIEHFNNLFPNNRVRLIDNEYSEELISNHTRNRLFSYRELEEIIKQSYIKNGNSIEAMTLSYRTTSGNIKKYAYYSLFDGQVTRKFPVEGIVDNIEVKLSSFANKFAVRKLVVYAINSNKITLCAEADSSESMEIIKIGSGFENAEELLVSFEIEYPIFNYDYQLF